MAATQNQSLTRLEVGTDLVLKEIFDRNISELRDFSWYQIQATDYSAFYYIPFTLNGRPD